MTTVNSKALRILRAKLEETKLRNPNWSMRAFAQRLGMSSGALSELMSGKRPMTLKTRRRIVERLQLSPFERREVMSDDLPPQDQKSSQYIEMDMDTFHMISDWWYFAILNLVKTVDFRPEIPWLVKRLGVSRTILKDAWERLFRLGYLHKNTHGNVVRRHPKLTTRDEILSLSIRKAHLEDLKLIEKSVLDTPLDEREVTSMTLAMRKRDMPRAKELIRQFQDEFCDVLELDQPDEVYRLSIAFIPLTARRRTKE